MDQTAKVIIVGAGPIGIACGIEARMRCIPALILEKGCLTNSIYNYPPQLRFFSSPRLLELADVPLVTADEKPARSDVLLYYRRLVEHFDLDVHLYEKVVEIVVGGDDSLRVLTGKRVYSAGFVVLTIGYYDRPNLLGVPGEDLPKVSHYYREPHPFFRQNVVVIGGQNSAVEAALELSRAGASVTLVHRRARLGDSVKYWIRPDIENRIKEGSIRAMFETVVERIEPDEIICRTATGERTRFPNDYVFAMTGYHTDYEFLQKTGIVLDPDTLKPLHDPATMESNVRGVYIGGVAAAGRQNNRLFIENTRYHAKLIFQDIERKLDFGHYEI